jgi:N-alpha-acetyl-L-2,4-diaminobutyrate deacetylase
VTAGQPVGQIHFLERPDREPAVVRAQNDGIVFVVRAIATTDQGDNVAVIARETTVEELY